MGITRENRILNTVNPKIKFEPKAEIATGMFLPNHSGINSHPEVKENLVPYTGANANVNLGTKSITTTGVTDSSLTASKPVFTDANKKLSSSGTVPIANGGTNSTSFTTNTIPYYNGTSIVSDTDLGYDGARLKMGASASYITNNPLQIYHSSTDYTNTGGQGCHMLFNNPSATGQSVFMNLINGTMRSKWRTDYAGNVSWVANGGIHSFYVGGDYGTGSNPMNIYSNYVDFTDSISVADSIASPAIEDSMNTGGWMTIGDPYTIWSGNTIIIDSGSNLININTGDLQINGNSGYSGTITTAKLTAGGANGSMTFTNGILTASTAAT